MWLLTRTFWQCDFIIAEMLAEKNGVIDMQCECCGTQYFFDKKAIEEFKAEVDKLNQLGL